MNNRILKAFAPLVLASLLFQPTAAFALTGGPFDNGRSPGASAGGTYSGVITGKNLIGLTQFGVSDSSESNGRFAVFHEGIMHYGVAESIADAANQRLAGTLLGVALLPDETDSPSATDANTTQDITVRGAAEGAWTAEMKGYPIAITFEGEGEIATVSNPATVSGPGADSVTIVGAGTANNNGDNDPQSVSAEVAADISTATVRVTTPFEIRGSRTSLTNFTALNSFSGIQAGPPLLTDPTP